MDALLMRPFHFDECINPPYFTYKTNYFKFS